MEENSLYFQVLILGESSVGKTSFLTRYVDDNFKDINLFTVGIDSRTHNLRRNNKNIMLKIYDTAGEERFRSIVKNYYKGADGIILMYDITNKYSFDSINYWLKSIKEATDEEKIGLVVVGNKIDLENKREVKNEETESLEKEIKMKIIEASAKLDLNVKETFNSLVDKMIEKKGNESSLTNTIKIKNVNIENGDKNNSGCCLFKKKKE